MYYKAKYARPVIQSDFFILYLEVISFFQKAHKNKKTTQKVHKDLQGVLYLVSQIKNAQKQQKTIHACITLDEWKMFYSQPELLGGSSP